MSELLKLFKKMNACTSYGVECILNEKEIEILMEHIYHLEKELGNYKFMYNLITKGVADKAHAHQE